MCICMLCMCRSHICGACGGQRKLLDPLEMELQEIVSCLMWVLGTKFGSSLEEQQVLLNAESSIYWDRIPGGTQSLPIPSSLLS